MVKKSNDASIYAGIFACLKERPMTMTELSEHIFNEAGAHEVGRIAVRLEGLISGDIAVPMVVKGKLFFRLADIKDRKVP